MRLNKECQQLRDQNASRLEQGKALNKYIDELKALHNALRELGRARKNRWASTKVDRNH